jgi:hypothetical protein
VAALERQQHVERLVVRGLGMGAGEDQVPAEEVRPVGAAAVVDGDPAGEAAVLAEPQERQDAARAHLAGQPLHAGGLRRAQALGHPQGGADLGDQPRQRERLVQEVVRAGLQGGHDVFWSAHARQEDEGDALELGGALDDLEERASVHVRHHDVAHDEVGVDVVEPHQGVARVAVAEALELRRPEIVRGQLAHISVVVDHDDALG